MQPSGQNLPAHRHCQVHGPPATIQSSHRPAYLLSCVTQCPVAEPSLLAAPPHAAATLPLWTTINSVNPRTTVL